MQCGVTRARARPPVAALVAVVVAAAAIAAPAWGQAWPARAVKIVVPSAPGDGSDLMARTLGAKLAEQLGQPFVIENRPGAGGIIGSEAVAKSAPDGYTLIVGNAGSHSINAALYPKLSYSPERDFVAVAMLMTAPNALVVNPQLPIRSVREMVDYAKSKPGLGYASGGIGSSAHLNMEAFRVATGIDVVHVPYKGSTPALTDIMAGQVPFMFVNLPPAVPLAKSAKIRVLAVTSRERSPLLPDVPTVIESGFPGFETMAWFGLLAPAGTSRDIVAKLNAEVARAMQTAEWKERIASLGGDTGPAPPEAFAERIRSDVARWRKVVAATGMKAE